MQNLFTRFEHSKEEAQIKHVKTQIFLALMTHVRRNGSSELSKLDFSTKAMKDLEEGYLETWTIEDLIRAYTAVSCGNDLTIKG